MSNFFFIMKIRLKLGNLLTDVSEGWEQYLVKFWHNNNICRFREKSEKVPIIIENCLKLQFSTNFCENPWKYFKLWVYHLGAFCAQEYYSWLSRTWENTRLYKKEKNLKRYPFSQNLLSKWTVPQRPKMFFIKIWWVCWK